jgi:hypothetical protein
MHIRKNVRIGLYQRIAAKYVNFPLAGFETDCNVVCDKPAVNPACIPAYKYPWQEYYSREGKFTGNIDISNIHFLTVCQSPHIIVS